MADLISYREAVAEGLARELRRDPAVVCLGEDIGAAGGVFKTTAGLLDEFGADRIWDTPISEQAILGLAMGAAMTGLRPVAEIMFADFLAVCWDYLANEISKARYMTGGQVTVPLVIREKAVAGSFTGTGPQHYKLGGSRKRSGIPGNAKPDGKGGLAGVTYPSLMEQAARGQPDRYVPQPWAGKDPVCVAGRWVLATGRTVAPEMAVTADGRTVILPWELTAAYHAGLMLGPVQDPVLTGAGHFLQEDAGDRLAAEIVTFIAAHPAR